MTLIRYDDALKAAATGDGCRRDGAARSCGFFAAGEPFDSEHWKTKVVFMLVQLIYTAVTLLPIPWLWQSFELHLAYLLCIYTVCVWNGGSYYIEVFSKAYRKQFEGDRDQRRRAVFESFGAPEGERPKRTPSVGDVAAAGSPAPDPLSAIPLASPHDRDSLPPPPDDGAAADGGARLKASKKSFSIWQANKGVQVLEQRRRRRHVRAARGAGGGLASHCRRASSPTIT